MEPILSLIAESGRMPPEALDGATQSTPYFQVSPQGFLLLSPSGGRIHYSPGQGIALHESENRPSGDMRPFVLTSGFAAAGWFDGRIPLSVNAVQLQDGRLLLLASPREDLHEAMALAYADAMGLPVSDAPVVIDPEDASSVCTNGQPMTQRRTSKDAPEPPVREGARRLATDRPAIDGGHVHACAGLVCLAEGTEAEAKLSQIALMQCIAEIKKHIFMPLVGNAIWGEQTMGVAHLVLANNLPMYRFTLPAGERPSPALVAEMLTQLKDQGE